MYPITGTMPPTASYAKRAFVWLPAVNGMVHHRREIAGGELVDELLPALGKLTIKLQPAATGWGRKIELDTYAVDECEPEQLGTRMFVFLNLTDPEQREPYRVTVGGVNRCRCKAGACRVPPTPGASDGCKHRDVVIRLIEEGALETSREQFAV